MECVYFGRCGGCSVRDLPYNEQLADKKEMLSEMYSQCELEELKIGNSFIVPSDDINFYRNKMEFTFGTWDGELVLGMHAKNKYYRIVDIEECFMQSQHTNKVLELFRNWAKEKEIPAYNKNNGTGILRYLIIKETKNIPGMMINLVATERVDIFSILDDIIKQIPIFSSMYLTINTSKSDVSFSESSELIWGEPFLQERIGDYKYRMGPYTFFQTNLKQTENLYNLVRDWLGTGDVLLDLYSGVGGFSINLASNFNKVIGVENHENSIFYATENSLKNNMYNCEFVLGDVEDILSLDLVKDSDDVSMIVDPPRVGLGKKMIKNIFQLLPQKLMYVSCNPKSLVRDINILKNAYNIQNKAAFDMFPQTKHIETVVFLKLKEFPNLDFLKQDEQKKVLRRKSLLNQLRIAKFRVDKDGNIMEANNTFFKFFNINSIDDVKFFDLAFDDTHKKKLIKLFDNEEAKGKFVFKDFLDTDFFELDVAISRRDDFFDVLAKESIADMENDIFLPYLDSILENSADIILLTDKDGNVEYANEKFEAILGYSREEIYGKNMSILKSGRQTDDYYKDMRSTIMRGEKWVGDIINKNKGNMLCYQNMTIIPVKKGELLKFIVVQKDITDFVYVERSFIDKDNELSKMTKITDELISLIRNRERSPLQAIKNNIEHIINSNPTDVEKINSLRNICFSNIEFLEKMINGVRMIPYLKDAEYSLNMDYFDMSVVIQEVLTEFREKIRAKNIELTFSKGSVIHQIFFDKDKIKEVIRQLLDNAYKFSPDGSVIDIKLKQMNGFVDILVTDKGPGITPEYKQKIFSKYLKIGVYPEKEGKGIGLAICKSIIEAHNGRIWVESNVGKSSTFIFKIPVERRIYTRKQSDDYNF
ncbi:23S rRNA (uracil(1939)-C(5))-methyltransferase RlmD [bacterium]